MSIILLTSSLLETGTVTVTSALAANPKTRLYDRDRSPQTKATAAGQWDVDIDMGAATPASAIAIVNHNLAANVQVYADSVTPPVALLATVTPTGVDPFYAALGAGDTKRYWRLRVLAFGSAPAIGELLLGVPRTLTTNPAYGTYENHVVGNVRRDESPGGYVWRQQRGGPRAALRLTWHFLPEAEWTLLQAAYADTLQGAKSFLIVDADAVARWVEFQDNALKAVMAHTSLREIKDIALQEAL